MIRLGVRVAPADAEIALAGLLDLAPDGLDEVARADGTIEYGVYRRPGEPPDAAAVRAALGAVLVGLSTTTVADDWAERWREFHRPSLVGDRLWVRAPWEAPAAPGLLDIEIEPAQAFGTGAHATTRLCLGLLLALEQVGGQARGPLLDIGCGSGVLAIAAAKLGWAPVSGIDHEPESVAATLENARANGVAIDARRLDILVDPCPSAPTVTANLLAPLLIELAARMTEAPQRLVAGGLAPDQADAVVEAFARHHGLTERERRHEGDWTALYLARDPDPAPPGAASRTLGARSGPGAAQRRLSYVGARAGPGAAQRRLPYAWPVIRRVLPSLRAPRRAVVVCVLVAAVVAWLVPAADARRSPSPAASAAAVSVIPPVSAPVPGVQQLSNERTTTYWAHSAGDGVVHFIPTIDGAQVTRLHLLTEDGAAEVYIVLRRYVDARGRTWLRIRVPRRPNGTTGWVLARALGPVHRITTHMVIDRERLTATLYDAGRVIWTSPVGVGKASTPTPRGNFWIREKLVALGGSNPIYGPYALGTSAYSVLTDWPGGGVVGIHGTNQPELIPGRPSHGCVRVPNPAIIRLYHLITVGTPVTIV